MPRVATAMLEGFSSHSCSVLTLSLPGVPVVHKGSFSHSCSRGSLMLAGLHRRAEFFVVIVHSQPLAGSLFLVVRGESFVRDAVSPHCDIQKVSCSLLSGRTLMIVSV